MRWPLAVVFLFLFVSGIYSLDLDFSSCTYLSPTSWTEELQIEAGHGGWSVRVGTELDNTGFTVVTLGGEYQTESITTWIETEFTAEDFSQLRGGVELSLTEFFGFGVEAVVDEGGFAGISFSIWYEAAAREEGFSGATGLFEFDGTGAVMGQTLCLGISIPPWQMESKVQFDERGFSCLELSGELSWEEAAVGVSFEWDPTGLLSVGGRLSVYRDPLVATGEVSWLTDGSWLATGDLALGEGFRLGGEISCMGALWAWGAELGFSLQYLEISFGIETSADGVGYSGGLSFRYETSSLELRGGLSPMGELELELFIDISISLEDEM